VTYLVSQLLPILCALLLSVFYMGALNYALFWSVPFGATARTNKALLSMSRLTLLLLDLALFGKLGSALLPTWTVRDFDALGLGFVAVAMGAGNDESDEAQCLCNSYWTLSLVSYVSAIYSVKLLYYKRASLMMADPMVATNKGRSSTAPDCSVAAVMALLVSVYAMCEYLVVTLTDSQCTAKGPGECCHDTFAPINTWFAIGAIALDLCVLVRFMARWNAFLSMFAEEAAKHMMNQFMLVSVVMLSCVWNALCHLSIVYLAPTPAHVDSFQGTPSFLLDVCIMATCVLLAFVDAQKTVAKSCEMGALQHIYAALKEASALVRACTFGDAAYFARIADEYNAADEEP